MLQRERMTKDLIPEFMMYYKERLEFQALGVEAPEQLVGMIAIQEEVLSERIGAYGVRQMLKVHLGVRSRVA